MADNLFEGTNDNQSQEDNNRDFLTELVGEDKKFKDTKELAKGKYIADQYVKTLESRLDEAREDYKKLHMQLNAGAKLEEQIERFLQAQQSSSKEPQSENDSQEKQPTLTLEEIEEKILSRFKQETVKEKEQLNFDTIQSQLKERFGNNYPSVLAEKRDSLGLTGEEINAFARKKTPQAFFRMLGLEEQKKQDSFQSPPRTERRSDSFSPRTEKRTWAWYQNLKKEQPEMYRSPKITSQMHKDALELGDEFNDGDFHLKH